MVDLAKVERAFLKLKEVNPLYADIKLDTSWQEQATNDLAYLTKDKDGLENSNDNNSDEEDSFMNVENNEVSPSASSQKNTMTDWKLQMTRIGMKKILL